MDIERAVKIVNDSTSPMSNNVKVTVRGVDIPYITGINITMLPNECRVLFVSLFVHF